MKRLQGKVALISGAAKGMGASHARAIVAEGGSVVIGDVDEQNALALVSELGSQATFARLDVQVNEDWDSAVSMAVETFGGLNVLVNNAGILRAADIVDMPDADWDLVMGINLTGVMKGMRAAIPALIKSQPSSIINISSTAGLKAFPGTAAYNTAKWGIRGLTKTAALELASKGVRVNSIHPGNVKTPMIDGLYMNYKHVAQGRAGDPQEISNLVVFLASDESSFSTGSEFIADGGETSGLPDLGAL